MSYAQGNISSAKLQKQLCNAKDAMNSDQHTAPSRSGTQAMPWSDATVKKALQLKFTCGSTGYQMLLDQGQPPPSMRTLHRRLAFINFQSGILTDVFRYTKMKVRYTIKIRLSTEDWKAFTSGIVCEWIDQWMVAKTSMIAW